MALDVFRGGTIAGMIVVNNPGTWANVYPPLLHAEWHGWTFTDTIFPFFLFIVGVSIVYAFRRRLAEGVPPRALALHAVRRGAILVALGLALNLLSFAVFGREHVRIPGVLQRIGVCFLAAALVFLWGRARGSAAAATLLLAGYWGLMTLAPVPGYGTGRLDRVGNFAAHVDRLVLGAHTWKPGWDPEGPLSTLPAIATTLLGVLAGERLRASGPMRRKVIGLAGWGAVGALAGWAWGLFFPINKNIWTSSYAVLMGGLAALVLAACLAIVDLAGARRGTGPLVWLGSNPIAAFVLSTALTIALLGVKVAGPDGKPRSLYSAIYRAVFDRFADPRLGSLLFAVAYLGLWVLVCGTLYRRRVFLRV